MCCTGRRRTRACGLCYQTRCTPHYKLCQHSQPAHSYGECAGARALDTLPRTSRENSLAACRAGCRYCPPARRDQPHATSIQPGKSHPPPALAQRRMRVSTIQSAGSKTKVHTLFCRSRSSTAHTLRRSLRCKSSYRLCKYQAGETRKEARSVRQHTSHHRNLAVR